MKNAFLALLTLAIIGISCKKSSSTTSESLKFMSFSANSTWTYETTNNVSATTTTNNITSTNRDSSISGKSYHVFTNSNGSGNSYYNITGHEYYNFTSLAALNSGNVDILYLKDDAALSTNWSQIINLTIPGISTPVPVTFTNTITEKGIAKTVSGNAYTDVIHITTTLVVPGLPPGSLTTDIQSYYAPKVGLIESKYKISLPLASINTDQSTILKTSTIR